MKCSRSLLCFFLLLFPFALFAHTAKPFILGKDYSLVTPATPTSIPLTSGKVSVVEFFSYGCPWCYKLEPSIAGWLKHKPAAVEFERVPVVFEPGWDVYSKAYYTAKALDVDSSITPALFDAIHNQHLNLTTEESMQKFFAQQGIAQKDFEGAYDYSPSIAIQMNRANTLMQDYKVIYIPTFLINGKYMVHLGMVKGDINHLMKVLDFLITKATKESRSAAPTSQA